MPKVTTTATATTTKEIKLRPEIRRRLLTEMKAYQELSDQIKALDVAKTKHKAAADKLRAATGEQTIELEGFKITEVTGVYTTLDEMKLMKIHGLSVEQINECKVTKPKKPYAKISMKEDAE